MIYNFKVAWRIEILIDFLRRLYFAKTEWTFVMMVFYLTSGMSEIFIWGQLRDHGERGDIEDIERSQVLKFRDKCKEILRMGPRSQS